jgi:hypothetical protein
MARPKKTGKVLSDDHRQSMVDSRHEAGYTQAKPRQVDYKPLGCAVCKRRDGDGHDSWCTPERRENAERDRLAFDAPLPMVVRHGPPGGLLQSVKPPSPHGVRLLGDLEHSQYSRKGGLAAKATRLPDGPASLADLDPNELKMRGKRGAEANRRRIAAEKETNMPTLAETVADLGMPAPIEARPETAECASCGTKPRAEFSTKVNGDPFTHCDPCRSARTKIAAAARKKPADPAPAAMPQAVAETAYAAMTETPIDTITVPVLPVSEADEAIVDELVSRTQPADQVEPIASPSRSSEPNGEEALTPADRLSLAQLRAERERLTAYLADLDRRIEEAEVLEQLGGKTPAELRALLEESQRMARLCQLALQGAA